MDEIMNQLAKKVSFEIFESNQVRNVIGAQKKLKFDYENRKYELTVYASWDKSRYYGYSVKGIGFNYEKSEIVAGRF